MKLFGYTKKGGTMKLFSYTNKIKAGILFVLAIGTCLGVRADAEYRTNAKENRIQSLLQKRSLKPLDNHTTNTPLRSSSQTHPEILHMPRESVDTVWVRYYSGPGGSDCYPWPGAIAVDDSSNVYIGGVSFGQGTNHDFTVIKYDKDGYEMWVARYDYQNGIDVLHDLAIDDSGYVYVTGMCGPLDYSQVLTIKYNNSGDSIWTSRHQSAGGFFCYGEALALDDSGNVYVTGGDVSPDIDCDYLTIKYDKDGNEIWAANYDWPGIIDHELANDIAVDEEGNVYVTGTYEASFLALTIKYSPEGETLWTRWSENNCTDGWHIALDDSANVFVAGSGYPLGSATMKYNSQGTAQWNNCNSGYAAPQCELIIDDAGNVIEAGPFTTIAGNYTVLKTDNSSGNLLWDATYDAYPGAAYDMTIDSCGSVYVTGFVVGPVCSKEYGTVKFDSNGNQIWATHYYHPQTYGYNIGYAVAIDKSGYVYVTGEVDYNGASDGPITTIKYKQLPVGVAEQSQQDLTNNIKIMNPIRNRITICFSEKQYGNIELSLYDVSGRLVKNVKANLIEPKDRVSIPADELSNGIFFLRIHAVKEQRVLKVVKLW
jgi:hypothetical protein